MTSSSPSSDRSSPAPPAARATWPSRHIADASRERAAHVERDPITGLLDRGALLDRTAALLADAHGSGRDADHAALLLVGVEGIGTLRERHGRLAADAVRQQIAERLLRATRGSDVVARAGDDAFGVLLDGLRDERDVATVAERVLGVMAAPFTVPHGHTTLGSAVGVARGGASAAHPFGGGRTPADGMLRNAALALAAARERGGGTYVAFVARHRDGRAHLQRYEALDRALERNELHLVYQPIVDLKTLRVHTVEALVRWTHPERGVVGPGEFVPLAEDTGLIVPIGRWVLETAARTAAAWSADGVRVSVNVSARQLQHPSFVRDVAHALDVSGLPAKRLLLELTESAVVTHPEAVCARLAALRARGVRLALDDFGTGYSALCALRQLPFDALKIDRSFIAPMDVERGATALTGAILSIGAALGLETVAEGIETVTQRDALLRLGCRLGQGYLLGGPVPAEEIASRLAASA